MNGWWKSETRRTKSCDETPGIKRFDHTLSQLINARRQPLEGQHRNIEYGRKAPTLACSRNRKREADNPFPTDSATQEAALWEKAQAITISRIKATSLT